MFIYTIRRFNLFAITFLLLTFIGYSLLRLEINTVWAQQPYLSGWWHYLTHLLNGNLGVDAYGIPMTTHLQYIFPATLELCFFAFSFSLLIGIPLGTLAGMHKGKFIDTAILSVSLIGYALPLFWVALLFILFFSLYLNVLPISGRYNLLYDIPSITGIGLIDILLSDAPYRLEALTDAIKHLILPTLVLTIAPTTEVIRLTRTSISDVIDKNYIKAAQTKGLSPLHIILKHTLRNAIPPIIPKLGIQFSAMMTFAMITESIFNWPGIGRWLLNAISEQDYVAIQAGVMVVATFILIANITADLLGAAINPLVRKEFSAIK